MKKRKFFIHDEIIINTEKILRIWPPSDGDQRVAVVMTDTITYISRECFQALAEFIENNKL